MIYSKVQFVAYAAVRICTKCCYFYVYIIFLTYTLQFICIIVLSYCVYVIVYSSGGEPFTLGWPNLKLCLIIWPQNKKYFNLEQSRFVYSLIMIKIIT